MSFVRLMVRLMIRVLEEPPALPPDIPAAAGRGVLQAAGGPSLVASVHYSLVARWLQERGRAQEVVIEMFRPRRRRCTTDGRRVRQLRAVGLQELGTGQ